MDELRRLADDGGGVADMIAAARHEAPGPAAMERMLGRLEALERGGPPTGVGIGIASGEAILGNVGSAHYMSHTIIGDAVNTAARLMQMARPGEALLARPVYEAAPDVFGAERVSSRGEIALRGKSEAIGVYSVRF